MEATQDDLSRQGHVYQDIQIGGNARVHAGDLYLNNVSAELEKLPSQSRDQYERMMGLLHRIDQQTMPSKSSNDKENHSHIYSEEAEEINDHLEQLLFALEKPEAEHVAQKRTRAESLAPEIETIPSLKRLRRTILSTVVQLVIHQIYTYEGAEETINVSFGVVAKSSTAENDVENIKSQFILGKVTVLPRQSSVKAKKVNLVFTCEYANDFTKHLRPILSFSSMTPNDSKIFRIIQRGDLEAMKRKFTEREAALSDCGEFGRSLLNVGERFSIRRVPKYLVERGADVQARELSLFYAAEDCFPLDQITGDDTDVVIECRRHLLDAGADPMAAADGDVTWEGFGHIVFDVRKTMRLYLNSGLVDLEAVDKNGNTALLSRIQDTCYGLTPNSNTMIALLLDRGASVNARNLQQESCLNLMLREHLDTGIGHRTIALLLERGADIYAKDCTGTSVTMEAFRNGNAILWLVALATCSQAYDIDKVLMEDHRACHDDQNDEIFGFTSYPYLRNVQIPVCEARDYKWMAYVTRLHWHENVFNSFVLIFECTDTEESSSDDEDEFHT
ncbi:MAG: hypothetical protein MMC33_000543 [Icmadophila ericetorum]|nr:hypothetical protein [Icmadophila ericetorum]